MSFEIPTFRIFVEIKLLESPQKYSQFKIQPVKVQKSAVRTGTNSFC